MFNTQHHAPAAAALIADLDAIARIETSLGPSARRATPGARPDFSRLARYIPNLKH